MTAGWRPSRLDVLLALAVTGAGVVEAYGRSGPGPGQVHRPDLVAAGALAAGVLLLLRQRAPIAAMVALTALSAVLQTAVLDADYPLTAWQFYSNLILAHTVGNHAASPPWRMTAGVLAVLAAYGLLQTLPGQDVAESLISAIFVGVAYGSGVLLRRQTARTRQMAERAAHAATDERTRIARDLHDVISHNVSLMTLQTGGVRMLLGDDPTRERERELLRGVEQAGRDAVAELRQLLGLLRDGSTPARLDRLDELAGPLRAAGLDVRIAIVGTPGLVPPMVELSAYRLVQEALTNTLKHAGATCVDVRIGHTADELRVEIADDGKASPTAGDGDAAAGHGLLGMRERVSLHGGTFQAGPRPDGGYVVTASFALGSGSSAHSASDIRSIRSPITPDPAM